MANCKIWDNFRRTTAAGEEAASGISIFITIVSVPEDVDSAYYSGRVLEVQTDANGKWECYVPQGSVVLLECEEFGFNKGQADSQKTIPAEVDKQWSTIT
jgi:hypothetical protein